MTSIGRGWRTVRAVAATEARSALRDPHVLIYSLLFPALLYPVMFWGMAQVSMLQEGLNESRVSRVGTRGVELPTELAGALQAAERIELVPVGPQEALREDLDVVLEASSGAAEEGGIRLRLLVDRALDRSDLARERLEEAVQTAREELLLASGRRAGLAESLLEPFEIREVNLASADEMGRFILGRILPLMIVVMAAMGAFYPAIETVVAERERGTLETLLVAATPRWQLVAGKFLVVVASGLVAILLNLGVLALTARQTILANEAFSDTRFSFPLRAVPLVALCSLLICILFGACFMTLAVFARSFKEGQSYITPFYILCFQPAILAAFPGVSLTTGIALIPVANVSILFREAMEGVYRWPQIGIVLAELLLLCALALALAARLLRQEGFLLSPEPGKPLTAIRRILTGGRP